ncbi:MAG TPA: response regulator [Gammaproteobacteria bacterium]
MTKREGKRILVVDDDRAMLSLITEVLRRAGYEASNADNAEEAIAAVSAATPDLAVLDIGLPGASGLDLAALLRDQFGVPFVFLTLHEDEAIVRRAAAAGALAYVVKPADMRQCVPTIDAAVARAAELRQLREKEAHLSTALQQSRDVSMAVGVLMERLRLDRDTAFERLREQARSQRRKIAEVAAELLDGAERLNALANPAAGRARRGE